MSKVTQVASADYSEDTSVSGCRPRKLLILDVLFYESVCCWISAALACICLSGRGPAKEAESGAGDEVVQMTVYCTASGLKAFLPLLLFHPVLLIAHLQPQTTLDGAVCF